MSKGRILLLVILALAMLVTAAATWGSIGSVTMVMCLLLMGCSLLLQHFVNRDDPGDYEMDV